MRWSFNKRSVPQTDPPPPSPRSVYSYVPVCYVPRDCMERERESRKVTRQTETKCRALYRTSHALNYPRQSLPGGGGGVKIREIWSWLWFTRYESFCRRRGVQRNAFRVLFAWVADPDPQYFFWKLDPDPHWRQNSRLEIEPWRVVDAHNGGLEAKIEP